MNFSAATTLSILAFIDGLTLSIVTSPFVPPREKDIAAPNLIKSLVGTVKIQGSKSLN